MRALLYLIAILVKDSANEIADRLHIVSIESLVFDMNWESSTQKSERKRARVSREDQYNMSNTNIGDASKLFTTCLYRKGDIS